MEGWPVGWVVLLYSVCGGLWPVSEQILVASLEEGVIGY